MSELRTFRLPDAVLGTSADIELGRRLIETWQADGILQIATDARQDALVHDAYQASRRFFTLPQQVKAG